MSLGDLPGRRAKGEVTTELDARRGRRVIRVGGGNAFTIGRFHARQ
ncbi:Uncharacterised protein [Mycobacterium tuberculosis]|nr:Uncharacterised protein [Mycobacterium tuberculosis]